MEMDPLFEVPLNHNHYDDDAIQKISSVSLKRGGLFPSIFRGLKYEAPTIFPLMDFVARKEFWKCISKFSGYFSMDSRLLEPLGLRKSCYLLWFLEILKILFFQFLIGLQITIYGIGSLGLSPYVQKNGGPTKLLPILLRWMNEVSLCLQSLDHFLWTSHIKKPRRDG